VVLVSLACLGAADASPQAERVIARKIEGGAARTEPVPRVDAPPPGELPLPLLPPPRRGAPRVRVGGATRGGETPGFPRLEVLVPEHAGLTLSAQPVFYWHLSQAADVRVDFTLVDPEAATPVVETTLRGPFAEGMHRIETSRHGVKLRRGVTYQWFVALVTDPERRSSDVIAGGAVELTAPPPDLEARLAQVSRERAPLLLAEHGIWYDAVDGLSRLIEASPDDPEPRRQRAALLSQVGLGLLAEADRVPPAAPER
jgi:hypothetical protein